MTAKKTTFRKFLKVFSFLYEDLTRKNDQKHRILLKTSPVSEGEVEQHHGTRGNRSILE